MHYQLFWGEFERIYRDDKHPQPSGGCPSGHKAAPVPRAVAGGHLGVLACSDYKVERSGKTKLLNH